MRSALVLAALAAAAPALAQSAPVAPPSPAVAPPGLVPPSGPTADPPPPAKQPSTAIGLSLGATLGGVALIGIGVAAQNPSVAIVGGGLGLLLGPATGRWYAGEAGGLGILLRTAGMTGMILGFVRLYGDEDYDCIGDDPACEAKADALERREPIDEALAIGGGALIVGSAIYDIATAGRAANRWNAEHHVTVAPTVLSSGGRQAAGLVIGGTF